MSSFICSLQGLALLYSVLSPPDPPFCPPIVPVSTFCALFGPVPPFLYIISSILAILYVLCLVVSLSMLSLLYQYDLLNPHPFYTIRPLLSQLSPVPYFFSRPCPTLPSVLYSVSSSTLLFPSFQFIYSVLFFFSLLYSAISFLSVSLLCPFLPFCSPLGSFPFFQYLYSALSFTVVPLIGPFLPSVPLLCPFPSF
jgi:hypothetical protein